MEKHNHRVASKILTILNTNCLFQLDIINYSPSFKYSKTDEYVNCKICVNLRLWGRVMLLTHLIEK